HFDPRQRDAGSERVARAPFRRALSLDLGRRGGGGGGGRDRRGLPPLEAQGRSDPSHGRHHSARDGRGPGRRAPGPLVGPADPRLMAQGPAMTASRTSDCLIVAVGPGFGTYPIPVKDRVTIGRSSENDVCIDDPSISRRHAVLYFGTTTHIED